MALSIGCAECVENERGLKTKGSNAPPRVRCSTCDAWMPKAKRGFERTGSKIGFRDIPIAYTR